MPESTMVAAIATSASGVLIAAGTTVATIIAARRKASADDVASLTAKLAASESRERKIETAFNRLYAWAIRLWRWALQKDDLPEEFHDPPARSYEDA